MATASGKLTALRVRNEKKPGRHSDGDNLYLQVSPSGAKSWLFLYRKDGRLREMGLGGLAKVSLATARDMAAEARKTFALGLDPIAEKRQRQDEREQEQARAKTFGEFADEYIAEHEMGWRNAKHRQQWRNTLMTHGAPLRAKTLDAITTEDVLECYGRSGRTRLKPRRVSGAGSNRFWTRQRRGISGQETTRPNGREI